MGFKIIEAVNGQDAIEKALQFKPDLILLDLRMPVLDGFGAVERMRSLEELRDAAIIAISASVFEATRQRALSAGFNDFLFKPIHIENMTAVLQKYLGVEWTYAERSTPLPEREAQTLLDMNAVPPLPPKEAALLYAAAVRGSHKKVLKQLVEIEKLDEQYRPLVTKFRALAQHFKTDEIVAMLKEMGVKPHPPAPSPKEKE